MGRRAHEGEREAGGVAGRGDGDEDVRLRAGGFRLARGDGGPDDGASGGGLRSQGQAHDHRAGRGSGRDAGGRAGARAVACAGRPAFRHAPFPGQRAAFGRERSGAAGGGRRAGDVDHAGGDAEPQRPVAEDELGGAGTDAAGDARHGRGAISGLRQIAAVPEREPAVSLFGGAEVPAGGGGKDGPRSLRRGVAGIRRATRTRSSIRSYIWRTRRRPWSSRRSTNSGTK